LNGLILKKEKVDEVSDLR
jgi:hypothetical protein